ncbi:MAG: recombinase family protein [Acetobacteraceae bacterium]
MRDPGAQWPMKYGYARVSPGGKSESVDAQARQLAKAGCKKVLRDVHVSGAKDRSRAASPRDRGACAGRRLMVTRLDRLARSTRDRLNTLAAKARGVRLGRRPKLTAHQQQEARRRRDDGEPIRDIARSFNVSHSTISRLAA